MYPFFTLFFNLQSLLLILNAFESRFQWVSFYQIGRISHFFYLMTKILNNQWLGDIAKRRYVLIYLRSLKYNLYSLQDPHFSKGNEIEVRTPWGFQWFFSSFSSNSREFVVRVNNKFDFKVLTEKGDVDGIFVLLKIV